MRTAAWVGFRRLRHLLRGAAIGLAVGVALAVAGPLAIGWRTMTVMSGSMAPTIDTGDAIVAHSVSPDALQSGDVVTFRDPEGSGRLITHRVRSVQVEHEMVSVVTKGDANNVTEQWKVSRDGTVGRVVYRIPRIGYALVFAASPLGRLLLLALPLLLLGVVGVLAIWRSTPGSAPDAGRPLPRALSSGRVMLALPPGPVRLALPAAPRSADDAS